MSQSRLLAGRAIAAILFAVLWVGLPTRPHAAEPDLKKLTCETLQQCLDYITRPYQCGKSCDESSRTGDRIPEEEGYFSLPEEFAKFGRDGIAELVGLLADPDISVRARAGYSLSALYFELRNEDLPAVRKAWLNGNYWLGVAAVRTAAIEPSFVAEMLDHARGRHLDDAGILDLVDLLGDAAYPEMLQLLQCRDKQPCDVKIVRLFATYLKGTKAQLDAGLGVLLDIALDGSIADQPRFAALAGIADRGRSSSSISKGLRSLLASPNPKIRDAASQVLVHLRDPAGVDAEIERLQRVKSFERVLVLWRIRELGPAAAHAAPAVRKLLTDDDWDVRAAAARVLGEMHDTHSIAELAGSITDNDWLLAYRAVYALGQMRSQEADAKLKDVAENYWLPLVREVASDAMAGKLDKHKAAWREELVLNPLYLYCTTSPSARSYSTPTRLADATAAPMELRIGNASFFGEDRGEFGGRVAVEVNGVTADLSNENLRGFASRPDGPIAIVGNHHMISNEGYVLRLLLDSSGHWTATREWRLPGAPSVLQAADGTIGVVSSAGGMLLTPEGKPEWLGCSSMPKMLK